MKTPKQADERWTENQHKNMLEWYPDIADLSASQKIARGEMIARIAGSICLNILYLWVRIYFVFNYFCVFFLNCLLISFSTGCS